MGFDQSENLLKSALEKVVFFECRIEQLERDLEATTAERDRLRQDLALGASRELALKQAQAELEARAARLLRDNDEAVAREKAYRAERERWLGRMIEGQRIRSAGEAEGDGGFDLASFIAELRNEVEALRTGRAAEPAVAESPLRSASEAAVKLAESGRIGLTDRDRANLLQQARFETRAEETVFAYSLKELSSGHAESRIRAAERLRALGTREAAAALASALNLEPDRTVRPALIEALAATAGPEALPLLAPHMGDGEPAIRLAALEATVKLGGARAEPTLRSALEDPSARVRRRAAILATSLGPAAGSPLLSVAAVDRDPAVRRVAMLSLASFGGEPARHALLEGANDSDQAVRRAACQGLSRMLGEPLLSLADEPAPRRSRELRRLQTAPMAPIREVRGVQVQEAVAEVAAPIAEPQTPAPSTADRVIREIATSLRGRTLQELEAVGSEEEVVMATAHLVEAGRLVRRNQRFFLA